MADKEIENLQRDLQALRQDVSSLTDSLKKMSAERVNAGLDSARASGEKFRQQAEEATRNLEQEIEARPFTSVLAAFGVGFIVGKLLDR
jgi:ElaB/YqjD/DUF883 family membrane-anchored ribosome-binding protein